MADCGGEIETKPKVRIGTPDELDDVMGLALLGCAENEFVPHNPALVLADVWAALNLHQGIVGVIGRKGALEGAVLLRVGTVWYSDAHTLEERAIFVHPDFRSAKGGRAAKLARFSMEAADRLGIPLTIGVLSDHRVEAKVRLYTRTLGKPSGAYWIYWPKGEKPSEGDA